MKCGVHVGAQCLLLFVTIGWTWGQSPTTQNTNFTRPIFNCGGHLVSDSGFLGSEDFPSYYKPNRKCTWYITVPVDHVVMLSFRIFDLEADPRCRYDYVDVYNGHSYTVQKLGRFCGTFRPGALISTSNTMMIEMVSDSSTGGRGFLAYFSGGKPHVDEHQFCGGRLMKPEGSVKTPNWPETNYPAGISCSWHITVEPNMVIEVRFEKFDLEGDSYCRYDYVAFFNGGETDDSRRIGRYCGDVVPENIVTNGNELLVQFVSDLSVTSDGFMAHYKSIPRGSKPPTVASDVGPGPRVDAIPTSPVRPTPKPKHRPAKPAIKPTTKPRVKASAKPTSRPKPVKLTPKPKLPPKAGSKPTPNPGTKPILKPGAKPGTKPTPKPGTKPGTKPIPKPSAKPSIKPTPKPATKPVVKPSPKPGTKLVVKPSPKPGTKLGAKPTPKPGVKPTPKPGTKTGTKLSPKSGTNPVPKAGSKIKIKPDRKPKPKVIAGMSKPGQNRTGTVVKRPGEHKKPPPLNPACAQVCKANNTLPTTLCSSEFVITGKVTALAPGSKGSVNITVSLLKAFKAGRLNAAQTGKAKTVKLLSICKNCPLLRRGMTYILTGHVDSDGNGHLEPSSFTTPYKAAQQKLLAKLTSQKC
ncbi:hypothetical protein JZ751_006908 [Albula glossodonta]|uniref:Procollagen C-endopeptidase enhancer n=1 Tax=Albula glossodonta TaxID=121402 RepID=A0A8T2PCZ3_9TELE|nr:hypothetical protein JZ751_006908 [Albula glossodonta]